MRRRFINSNQTFDYSNYMTIEALEDGYEVYFNIDLEYNLNGNKWMILKAGFLSPNLKKGDLLSLRCSLAPSEKFGRFNDNGKAINLRGNILSLIFKDDINLDISHYCDVFYYTFFCNNIVSVEKNFLPATTLAEGCYFHMFEGCHILTTAPELPATTLAVQCYDNMFYNCTSLTTAPKLPATTLTDYCYYGMFWGCTSLTTAPKLPATTLANYCYSNMFRGCISLTTAPELPATTLARDCYNSMFDNCTNLTTAPSLPATTLEVDCYKYMFAYCSKLNYIKMLATNISASNCLYGWVNGVASTGTFVKNPAMTSLLTGTDGIPYRWTVVNDGEDSGNLITFTVNGTEYQAEKGMTFYDWAMSEYYDSSCPLRAGYGYYTNLRDDIIQDNISSDDSIPITYERVASLTPDIYTDTIIQPISYTPSYGGFD